MSIWSGISVSGVGSLRSLGGTTVAAAPASNVNFIQGDEEDNALYGTSNHDFMYGRGGNDLLRGGHGNDVLDGGDGNDRLHGDHGNDLLIGGAGDDRLFGGRGSDILDAGTGDDILHGNRGDDLLRGREGNDRLFGGWGDDIVEGGIGDDLLGGYKGDDTLDGGAGDDRLYGSWGNDVLEGGSGDDTLFGGQDNDTLEGGSGDDSVYGESGDDIINMAASEVTNADILDGGSGADTLNLTGGGAATFTGDNLRNVEVISLNEAQHLFDRESQIDNSYVLTFDSTYTQDISVEAFSTARDFTLDASASSADFSILIENATNVFQISTGSGDDVVSNGNVLAADNGNVSLGAGNDSFYAGDLTGAVYVDGEAGDDTIYGGRSTDTLRGGEGNDTILGGMGQDQIYGGEGDDVLSGGDLGFDYISGGAGDDTILTSLDELSSGRDTTDGGEGLDTFSVTGGGASTLVYDAGITNMEQIRLDNNFYDLTIDSSYLGPTEFDATDTSGFVLYAEFSAADLTITTGETSFINWINTGLGDDVISASGSDVMINSGAGDDTVTGSANSDDISGGEGDDTLFGEGGHDILLGGAGDDVIYGGAGDDTIRAEEGNDTLFGGAGDDLIFTTANELQNNADVIDGGEGVDSLKLEGGGSAILTGDLNVSNLEQVSFDNSFYDLTIDSSYAGPTEFDASNVSGFVLHAGESAADLTVTTGESSFINWINTGSGNDVISASGSDVAINSGAGDDTLTGGANHDDLSGGEGDDTLYGEGGHDILRGEGGNDTLFGGSGNDNIFGGSGDDVINMAMSEFTLEDRVDGGTGTDTLNLASAINHDTTFTADNLRDVEMIRLGDTGDIVGRFPGDGVFTSGSLSFDETYSSATTLDVDSGVYDSFVINASESSADFTINLDVASLWGVNTGSGNDTVTVGQRLGGIFDSGGASLGAGDDTFFGGAGSAAGMMISGEAGDDTIYTGMGDDVLDGGEGDDALYGGHGIDSLSGGAGDDTIFGGSGDDTIFGGAGDDVMWGEEGDDRFIYDQEGNNTYEGGTQSDVLGLGDVLVVEGSGVFINSIDSSEHGGKFSGIEVLDITGSGDNTLNLAGIYAGDDLAEVTDTGNVVVKGNEGDSVLLNADQFMADGQVEISGETYTHYVGGSGGDSAVDLYVNNSITTVII